MHNQKNIEPSGKWKWTRGAWLGLAAVALLAGTAQAERTAVMNGTWALLYGIQPIPIGAPAAIPSPGITVELSGAGPAKVQLPPNVFSAFSPTAFGLGAPDVQQLQTSFMVTGPTAAATLRPGGRTGPDTFHWCPGQNAAQASAPGGVGGCLSLQSTLQGGTGTFNGIVKYTRGANKYSAIAQLLLTGTGTISFVDQTAPLQVRHIPLGGSGIRADGGPFGNIFVNPLSSAAPVTEPVGVTPSGLISVGGPTVNTVTDLDAVTDHGFSLTTGMVTISATDVAPSNPSMVLVSGTDQRTAKGAGNLVLVSGGLSKRTSTLSGITAFGRTGTLTLQFTNLQQAIPAASPTAIAVGAVGLVGVAGYAIRRGRAAGRS